MGGRRPDLTISVQLDLSLTVTVLLVLGVARLSWLLLSLTEWIACELNFNWLIKGRVTSLGRWRGSNPIARALAFCLCGLPLSPNIQSRSLGVNRDRWKGGKHRGWAYMSRRYSRSLHLTIFNAPKGFKKMARIQRSSGVLSLFGQRSLQTAFRASWDSETLLKVKLIKFLGAPYGRFHCNFYKLQYNRTKSHDWDTLRLYLVALWALW